MSEVDPVQSEVGGTEGEQDLPPSEEPGREPVTDGDPSREPPFTHTRASGFWAAVVGGLLVLVLLIVFILENGQKVTVSFVGAHGRLPEGVALLLAAVIGGLIVVIAAAVRILELRRRSQRQRPQAGSGKPRVARWRSRRTGQEALKNP